MSCCLHHQCDARQATRASVSTDTTKLGHPIASPSMRCYCVPSRIPRPIQTTVPVNPSAIDSHGHRLLGGNTKNCAAMLASRLKGGAKRQKGYLLPTFASSQHQRERQTPSRNKGEPRIRNTASTASSDPPAQHVAKERFVSKIPVLSRKRVDIFSRMSTTSVSAQSPTPPPPKSSSPPPPYTEHSDAYGESYSVNTRASCPRSSQSPPKYLERAPRVSPKLSIRPDLCTPKSRLGLTKFGYHSEVLEPSEQHVDRRVNSLCEGLDEDSELDFLSRDILRDIFTIIGPDSSMGAVALSAYVS